MTTNKRRNTFTRAAGAVYTCECCGRRTRNTGEQAIGSKTCTGCWRLAGIENEISDGFYTADEARAAVADAIAIIRECGGDPSIGFAGLMAEHGIQ